MLGTEFYLISLNIERDQSKYYTLIEYEVTIEVYYCVLVHTLYHYYIYHVDNLKYNFPLIESECSLVLSLSNVFAI